MNPRAALVAGMVALGLWLACTLPYLDRPLLQDTDELAYAQVAKHAAVLGQWWPLISQGRPFYEKPPLPVWQAALAARAAGQPLAAWPYRLGPCLGAGLALGAVVALLALVGAPSAGWAAAGLLALQGDWLFHARFFSFDAAFVGWSLAALLAGAWALAGPPRRWWLPGLLLALAAWTKSWFVLALAPAWAWALATQLRGRLRGRALTRLALPVLLALALWVGVYVAWNGVGFLGEEWSVNLMGRALGRSNINDPQGHVAFYLKWAQRSFPALLPLVLALPLGLAPRGRDHGPVWRWARAYTWTLCVSWALGLWLLQAETINYTLPLEAGLCLGLGLVLAEGAGAARSVALTALLLGCAAAAARVWPPELSLALGLPLGLLLAWARRRQGAPAPRWPVALAGAVLLLSLLPEAVALETRPLDGSAALVALLRQHPARYAGEPLVQLGSASLAAEFYSDYQVSRPSSLPAQRPPQACAVLQAGQWIFYPAQDAPPTRQDHGQ